jgi:hypothetical protein
MRTLSCGFHRTQKPRTMPRLAGLFPAAFADNPDLFYLRYCLADVPPQPNSPPDYVLSVERARLRGALKAKRVSLAGTFST